MKKILLLLNTLALIFAGQGLVSAQTTIKVFDTVTFYDGYAAYVDTPAPAPGVLRLRNDLYSRKLTTAELASIGNNLDMTVTIGALCDNYDRIGSIDIALVPKGATTYNPDSIKRIEIARYITPFMNKNKQPTNVPYQYNLNSVAYLLKETSITTNYDIWMELQVFGVPYAANTQVVGCSGRNDVFHGSINLVTSGNTAPQNNNVLIPVSFYEPFHNYDSTSTDTIGKTTKTFKVNVPTSLSDAAIFLIMSNHGADSAGEEYNRRQHYVYFDNDLKLTFTPGRSTCEPFRMYNTQRNGIYGDTPLTPAEWQSFSNWCPGDVITTRIIDLGPLTAGEHSIWITVPTAQFVKMSGNFPLSIYLQGKTTGSLGTDIKDPLGIPDAFNIYPSPTRDYITILNKKNIPVQSIRILNLVGAAVYESGSEDFDKKTIQMGNLSSGMYLVQIQTPLGTSVQKIQVLK
jgi:hypothetical protein